ncbi:cytochrome P450 [Tanacetum coccineum]
MSPGNCSSDKVDFRKVVVDNVPSREQRYAPVSPTSYVDLSDATSHVQHIAFHDKTKTITGPIAKTLNSPIKDPSLLNTSPSKGYLQAHLKQKKTTRTVNKFASLKLIHPTTGVNLQTTKRKIPLSHTSNTAHSSSSHNTSISNNDSSIQRCNTRLIKNATSTNIITDNEIQKTVDIGSSIGYDLAGKEEMESKYNKDDSSFIHSLWGFRSCGFAIKKSDGNSGGIIAIWNKSMFMEQKVVYGDGFLAVYGQWIHFNTPCLMIVVYAPQEFERKVILWDNLSNLVTSFNGPSLVFGDFNEVHEEAERMGSIFCHRGARAFNSFILNSDLIDLPLSGRNFTRINKRGTKLSKLDRFLVSNNFLSTWPNSFVTVLLRDLSDHCPIILKTQVGDYGPIPFKFFNSWLLDKELSNIVTHSWSYTTQPYNFTTQPLPFDPPPIPPNTYRPNITHSCHFHSLKNKLKTLKSNIRLWRSCVNRKNDSTILELKSKINLLESKAEVSGLSNTDLDARISMMKQLCGKLEGG